MWRQIGISSHQRQVPSRGLKRCRLIHLLILLVVIAFLPSFSHWLFIATEHPADWSFSTASGDTGGIEICTSDWYAPIRATVDGSYRLQLNLPVDSTIATTRFNRVHSSKVMKFDRYPRPLSFEDMAAIEDRLWRLPVDNRVYLLYPQSLNMSEVVSRVKSCRAVPESPENNPPIQLLHVSSTICLPVKENDVNTSFALESKYDLVVMVKSAVYNFHDRQTFRSLYARINDFSKHSTYPLRIGILFSVGLPRRSGNRIFDRDGYNLTLTNRAGEALKDTEHTHPLILRHLRQEVLQYNDLLVGDYEDTYYNLTTKMMTAFQWAARFCRTERPGFLFIDDDFGFHPANLRHLLGGLEADWRERMIVGVEHTKVPVLRFGKTAYFYPWAFSKREMPWPQLAPYSYGAFYFLGYEQVEKLAIAMHFTRPIPVDDVWLGLIMTKLGLRFQYRPGIRLLTRFNGIRKREIIMPMPALYKMLRV
ncbi:unnamed protein product [Dibothriocephalus latus]|uniref:Hexosyltransferase n=1 Tax=Dibothriocephalus latus TaxID=60516 RepID=A0A3P7M8Q4_DIBLA|nr:unnamed protein product [Dibothriocephalus latus]